MIGIIVLAAVVFLIFWVVGQAKKPVPKPLSLEPKVEPPKPQGIKKGYLYQIVKRGTPVRQEPGYTFCEATEEVIILLVADIRGSFDADGELRWAQSFYHYPWDKVNIVPAIQCVCGETYFLAHLRPCCSNCGHKLQ